MQAYTEIAPPTATSHAVAIALTGPKSVNLVVAKICLLQVFDIHDAPGLSTGRQESSNRSVEPSRSWPTFNHPQHSYDNAGKRLVLVGEFPVAGTITSIAAAKVSGTRSNGDALLVAFRDAKVSLLEWDSSINSLATISIHFFENESANGGPWMPSVSSYPSSLITDPRHRCAALRYGQRSLAILPFRQSSGDAGADAMVVDDDDDLRARRKSSRSTDAGSEKRLSPLDPSYPLLTTMLDPDLVHPVDMAFLYEYREPTLGVLSAMSSPSKSLVAERHDSLTFTTFTIDFEERARTQLLAIRGLPMDLFKMVPLSLPIGGTLLIGCNELIHVDQSGKTYGVAVNEFAAKSSSLTMNDQSSLKLKLEGSLVQRMSHSLTSLLLVMRSGQLVTVSFKMEGRTMAGMSVVRVPLERGGSVLGGSASCAALVGVNTLFVGSLQGDAALIDCTSESLDMTSHRSAEEMLGPEGGSNAQKDELDDEDDLYGDVAPQKQQSAGSAVHNEAPRDLSFSIQDLLPNYAPLSEAIVAQQRAGVGRLDLVLPTGSGGKGSLTFLNRTVPTQPVPMKPIEAASKRVWIVGAGAVGSASDNIAADAHKTFVIADHRSGDAAGSSSVRSLNGDVLEEIEGTDFEQGVETIFAGSLAGGNRIIQISPTEVRSYDSELRIAQILPMADEDSGTEFTIRHASFLDPYLLLVRDDASAMVLRINSSGELEEITQGEKFSDVSWTSGSIHNWAAGGSDASLYMLTEKGALHIYSLPDLSKAVYVAEDLRTLPPVLTSAPVTKRGGALVDSLAEILVADLGTTEIGKPFLFVRTENDDVEIYEPFHTHNSERASLEPKALRWIRRPSSFAGNVYNVDIRREANDHEEQLEPLHPPMTMVRDLNGYHAVFLPGRRPSLVFKEPSSHPKVFPLGLEHAQSLASWQSNDASGGFACVTAEGTVEWHTISSAARFGNTGWASRRLYMGEEVENIAYHSRSNRFLVGSNEPVQFQLPEDEASHHAWVKEEISFHPEATHSAVKLLNPETWSIIDVYPLPYPTEQILCMCVGNLEISELTHERRQLVCVGTMLTRGEDLPAMGCVYIFDIVRVAPNPSRPGTELALKLLVREEVRGAVTSLCEAGAMGLLMIAMGQKINVRGLTEAGTLLPAAFIDVQEHVASLKNLKGTGLCLAADAYKGVWFIGFQAEPFKTNLFGKSRTDMAIAAADFLPYDKQLLVVVADVQGNLHMLEYKPENPASQLGQRLIHRGAIHTSHHVVSSLVLPCSPPTALLSQERETNGDTTMSNNDAADAQDSKQFCSEQLLLTHDTGALALVQPLSEAAYRRLTTLQSFLHSTLDTPCGLNPRSHRAVDPDMCAYRGAVTESINAGAAGGARAVLDGAMAARWRELGARGRNEAWGRVGGFLGGGESEILAGVREVEVLTGAGLSYL